MSSDSTIFHDYRNHRDRPSDKGYDETHIAASEHANGINR